MDATFNTNRSKLLLGIITGVTNTGSSFPAMQSFIKSESQLDWTFMLEYANQKLWKRPPRVIIADFGKGLGAAILIGQFIAVVLQLCQWHAAAAMKKRIDQGVQTKAKRPYGYSAEERKEVKELFWPYLKSETVEELELNRKAILNTLHPLDQVWFKSTYIEKERQLITCYVK
jgi:MULE transposase domain